MSWVWEKSAARGTELLVLLALADFSDDAGRNAYPSTETLGRKCRVDVRTIQRIIGKMLESGYIQAEPGGGRGRTNRYRIVMENPGNLSSGDPLTTVDNSDTPAKYRGNLPMNLAVNPGNTPASDAQKGDTAMSPEPSRTRTTPPPPQAGERFCKVHKRPRRNCDDCARPPLPPRPPWCGECDAERTRLVEAGDGTMRHCPRCHPLKVNAA